MKKRILSLILTIVLLCGAVPLSVQALSNDDALVAYNDLVQSIITQYGYADGVTFEGAFGLADAQLLDFNGDGTQELILVWGNGSSQRGAVYAYSKGVAAALWENKPSEYTGNFNISIDRVGNATYLVYGTMRHVYTPELVCKDGKYVESSGDWTEADDDRVWAAAEEGGRFGEGDMRCTIMLEKYGVTDDASIREYLWSYDAQGALHQSKGLSATLATLSNAALSRLSFEETKEKLPYTGDLPLMNLSPEQALAFAEVLKSYTQPITKVTFFDGGNGIPVMWVAFHQGQMASSPGLITTSNFWEWTGTRAIKCSDELSYGSFRYVPEKGALYHRGPPIDGQDIYYVNPTYSFPLINGRVGVSRPNSLIGISCNTAEYGEPPLHPLDAFYDECVVSASDWDESGDGFSTLYLKDFKPITAETFVNESNRFDSILEADDAYLGVKLDKWGPYIEYKTYGNWADKATVQTLLTNYAALAEGRYTYPDMTDDTTLVAAITKALADQLNGKIIGLYKLSDGLYYVIIDVGGSESGALVKSVKVNGQPSYKLVANHKTPVPQKELAPYINDYLSRSNIAIDYDKTTDFKKTGDYTGYLKDVLNNVEGEAPNDAAKGELASYIESSISEISTAPIKCGRNKITVRAKDITGSIESAQTARDEFSTVLEENGVALNKDITIIVRIVGSKIDMGKALQVTLDPTLADSLQGATLHILLGDGTHALRITEADLKELLSSYGTLVVQIQLSEDGKYTINFLDESGAVLERIGAPITVFLPASSPYSTVFASYKGGSDNWGGQYDEANHTINFATVFSGVYEIMENTQQIKDIGELSDEEANAIRFMVSKGYFTLDESGAFYPDAELTRYDFTSALVGMFFALDRELKTSFPDVPENSDYYAYVASAEADDIVKGFDDGSFGGDKNITCEQVLALAARTLADKKGYSYPENAFEYLSFDGGEAVSKWAVQAVALAVREGIVAQGESLLPTGDISRSDAALYLYRLFMLLYEVSPVAITIDSASAGSDLTLPISIAGGALLLLAGGTVVFIRRKKAASGVTIQADAGDSAEDVSAAYTDSASEEGSEQEESSKV